MKKEAEKYAEEDRKRREEIEKKNQLESLIYASKKSLEEYGSKIPEDLKKEIEDEIKEAERIYHEGDIEKIKEEIDKLGKKVEKIGAAMYQRQEQEKQEKKDKGEYMDANYEEKK